MKPFTTCTCEYTVNDCPCKDEGDWVYRELCTVCNGIKEWLQLFNTDIKQVNK